MINKNKFGEYVSFLRKQKKFDFKLNTLAEKLGVSAPFMTGVEKNSKQFSDEKLEKFAEVFDLNETEFAEIILQRAIDQYNLKRGKQTLNNLKKLLPLYKKAIDGELEGFNIERKHKEDPIKEIFKNIDKIKNRKVREFLTADVNYALQRFQES